MFVKLTVQDSATFRQYLVLGIASVNHTKNMGGLTSGEFQDLPPSSVWSGKGGARICLILRPCKQVIFLYRTGKPVLYYCSLYVGLNDLPRIRAGFGVVVGVTRIRSIIITLIKKLTGCSSQGCVWEKAGAWRVAARGPWATTCSGLWSGCEKP